VIVSLAKYKRAIGETDAANDQYHQEALDDAEAAVAAYSDRDLGVAVVEEDRTFAYDASGYVEIDDASVVNSVRFETSSTALNPNSWEAMKDGPAGVPYSYLLLPPSSRFSPEMGFTYNLDVWAGEGGALSPETRVVVNAEWGWATVPGDIQRAVIWTAQSYESMSSSEAGALTAHSVAEVSKSYTFVPQQDQEVADLPARAKGIIDNYRRHVL
jgi:hypothetical protein